MPLLRSFARSLRRLYRTLPLLPLLTLLAASVFLPAQAVNAIDQTFPVRLTRDEHLLLEQVVCGQQYGVAVADIDARAFDTKASKANYADVRCRPHARLRDQPLYYVAQCARADNQWSCGQAELETIVALKERNLRIRPGSVKPELAYDAISKVSTYGYFQGNSIDAALQSTCNMGMGKTADLIEISCQRWSVTVSFWCPASPLNSACPRVIYMAERP
jgi:hypothetical protein